MGLGKEHARDALDALTRAFELWPSHDGVAYNLAIASANLDQIDRARELYALVARRDHSGEFGRMARERLDEIARERGW